MIEFSSAVRERQERIRVFAWERVGEQESRWEK